MSREAKVKMFAEGSKVAARWSRGHRPGEFLALDGKIKITARADAMQGDGVWRPTRQPIAAVLSEAWKAGCLHGPTGPAQVSARPIGWFIDGSEAMMARDDPAGFALDELIAWWRFALADVIPAARGKHEGLAPPLSAWASMGRRGGYSACAALHYQIDKPVHAFEIAEFDEPQMAALAVSDPEAFADAFAAQALSEAMHQVPLADRQLAGIPIEWGVASEWLTPPDRIRDAMIADGSGSLALIALVDAMFWNLQSARRAGLIDSTGPAGFRRPDGR